MYVVFCLSILCASGQSQQPAFLVVNEANAANYKAIENEAVIAFAQTPQGRVLFSPFGAFVGVANGPDSTAVLQVGFSPKQHKKGLTPKLGKTKPMRINHFTGSSRTWQKGMKVPEDLTYPEVWPGIDLTFLTRGKNLEFQLFLEPGAHVGDVALTTGATQLRIVKGSLIATLEQAELQLSKPIAFQMVNGVRVDVPVTYRILGNGEFGFELGSYNPEIPLVIDPVLSWSTFFGGSGARSESERAVVLAVNGSNELIIGGETTTPDFPVTAGVFGSAFSGHRDLFIGKLSADGTTFSFLTFFGSSGDDRIYDIDLDANENIVFTGEARADDFPISAGAFDTSHSDDDAFLSKLSADGSALIFSTFVGGSGSDEGQALIIEPSGSILLFIESGSTSTDMPVTPDAADPTPNGFTDVFIARISADGTQLLYGSYFGGNDHDSVVDALRLSDGRIMFAGDSESPDLPTTLGASDETANGGDDMYIAILSSDGTTFSQVTYLGGSDDDLLVGLDVDGAGSVFVAGYSTSNDFPTPVGAFDTTFNGDRDGVVAKLSGDLSTQLAGTYLGAPAREFIRAMALDPSGLPVVLGTTSDPAFPTTMGAFDETYDDSTDTFAAKLDTNLSSLSFSTFLGGESSDSVGGIAIDGSGQIYGAGSTRSANFPATTANRNGGTDVLVYKLSSDGSSLVYANLFGGGGADFASDALRLDTGEILLVGNAGSTSFPVTAGVFDNTIVSSDGFVSKLDASGNTLLFSTFLGGSREDDASTVGLDSMGNILVGGTTQSADFPVTSGAFDETLNANEDIFIAKLSATGDSLSFATFVGGTTFQTIADLAVADDNSIYLTGNTSSADFPVTTGAFDETLNGSSDVFIAKLAADGSALGYSTFLGSPDFDQGRAIHVDSSGQAIIAGTTRAGFPTTPGAFDETHNNGTDAFVTKLNATGSSLVFSTYLGGDGGEVVEDMIVASNGDITVGGNTGINFPTTAGAFQETFAGFNDGYFSTLSADGSQLLYSSYLGGSHLDSVVAFAFDANENLIVVGETGSDDFPTTAFAQQTFLGGEDDGFISLFGCSGTQLQYSTYWGGDEEEEVAALASTGNGVVTLFGSTESLNFPTTPGVFDTSFSGGKELFLTQFDLRSEELFRPDKPTAVQGLNAITLEALLPPCATDPLDVQWFNETAGTMFPLNMNPVSLTPTPIQSLTMRVDVTNTTTANTASRHVRVLVAENPLYFDLNSDGCNSFADIHVLAAQWLTTVAGDPNGDDFIDIRDFLYINTDDGATCQLD